MFDYNENNVYDRCGSIDVPYNPNLKPEFTGKLVKRLIEMMNKSK